MTQYTFKYQKDYILKFELNVQNYELSISLLQVSDTGGGGGGLLQGDLNGVHYSLPGL